MKRRMAAFFVVFVLVISQISFVSFAAKSDNDYVWNLGKLFASETDFEDRVKSLVSEISKLKDFQGKIYLDPEHLKFIKANEKVINDAKSIYLYGLLMRYKDVTDSKALEHMNLGLQILSYYDTSVSFYYEEVFGLSAAKLEELIANKNFAEYKSLYQDMLKAKGSSTRAVNDYESGFSSGYSQMYYLLRPMMEVEDIYSTLTMGELDYTSVNTPDGKVVKVNDSTIGSLLTSYSDSAFRKTVYEAYMNAYTSKRNTLAAIYNKHVSATVLDSKLFGYNSSIDKAFDDYEISSKAYSRLTSQTNLFIDQSKRLDKLAANLSGKSQIHEYDQTISQYIQAPKQTYTMEQAKTELMEALSPLGKDYVEYVRRAFDEGWIDAVPSKGKTTGAFTIDTPQHPYVLVNFYGTVSDVDTIAHELGHAINFCYTNKAQYRLMQGQSLAATEAAASVNEYLFYLYKYKKATSDNDKLYYLYHLSKTIEGLTFNQMMYSEFEEATHKYVEDGGVLTADVLDKMWAVVIDKYENSAYYTTETTVKTGWALVPHFYSDFYVMNYAFAGTVGNYVIDQLLSGKEPQWYKDFLSSGRSKNGMETIKGLGVDLEGKPAYESIYNKYKKLIDEVEALLNKTTGKSATSSTNLKLSINGKLADFDGAALSQDGSSVIINLQEFANQLGFESETYSVETYDYQSVPVSYFDEILGRNITFNEQQERIIYKKAVKISKGDKVITFVEDSDEVMVNTDIIWLDHPVKFEDGVAAIFLENLSEAFDVAVEYNPIEQTVMISGNLA